MNSRGWTARVAVAAALAAAVAIVVIALAPAGAKDSYLGYLSAPGGVVAGGSPYRYVAISPNTRRRQTVVERIDRDGGRVDRWWYLKGGWAIPAGSYSRGGTGLAADAGTLVLTSVENGDFESWPPVTRLAVLDTEVQLRSLEDPDGVSMAHAVRRISLRGQYEVAAVSPDGSVAYLVETLHPHRFGTAPRRGEDAFAVRSLDLLGGRLAPAPLRDREGEAPRLAGSAIDRIAGEDGRWSYGLYVGERDAISVVGIDTATGTLARVALPRAPFGREPFSTHLALSEDGASLLVLPDGAGRGSAPLLTVPLPLAGS